MPDSLQIQCPKCKAEYSVGGELAGHRVRCADCGERFEVDGPGGGGEPEGRVWRFRMPGGQSFGPLSKLELDEYLFEGILTAECQVLREGDERWQWAGEVYPEVPEAQSKASRRAGAAGERSGGLASAGLLERIPCIRGQLPAEHARSHDLLDALAKEEVRGAGVPVRFLGSRTIGLVQSVVFGTQFARGFGASLPPRGNVLVNSLAVQCFESGPEEFYLVVPHSNLERLPHEFFAILPGGLPAALALRAGAGSAPVWLGGDGSSQGAMAVAMRNVKTALGEGINWKWASRDKKLRVKLDWGIQMVPLGVEQFVLIAQTGGMGRRSKLFGIEWFLAQIAAARKLRVRLNLPGSSAARFPCHSETAELLARMFGDG